ncbi:MAG: hypothetical protein KIG32_06575, partial [Ruminiclostridium sp.]|nr:hypothetical protein [Ruminiclostridium sp.]
KYCYFDKTVYSGDAVGYNGGTPTSVLGKSSDKFSNGEVAYLLNGDQSSIIWGQTINSDKLPVIGGAQVYATTGCMTFSNDSAKTEAKDHDFSKGNGICNDCGAYEPAESVDDVYQIDSVTDLYWFAEQVNSGNTSYNAVLTADITVNSGVIDSNGNLASDTTGFMQWTPMGTSDKPYKGIFDGQGHKISGLYFNTPSIQYVGFFGRIGTGTIKNLGVVDSYFLGNQYVGGICGYSVNGIISGCYSISAVYGEYSCGGICGNNDSGAITNCCSNSDIGPLDAVGSYYDDSRITNTISKTTDEFERGVAAYVLNGGESPAVWGQEIGVDKLPVFGGMPVYATTGCVTYSNDPAKTGAKEHDFSKGNGICDDCGAHQPALSVNGVYQISNANELYWFAEEVNSGNTSINAVLTANIKVNEGVLNSDGTLASDTSGFKKWMPIGYNNKNEYIGTFDGQGHTISGLYVNYPTSIFIGLFGNLGSNGTIKNVGVVNSYLSGSSSVGGICGFSDGTITGCYNTSTVIGTTDIIGGIAGYNGNTVSDCYNTGKVDGAYQVGGICGVSADNTSDDIVTISNCYNSGAISGAETVGGVCGLNQTENENSVSTIIYCYNTGNVRSTNVAGGISGENYYYGADTVIKYCYNTGAVTSTEDAAGGICGTNGNGTIEYCYNTGSVSSAEEYGAICSSNYYGVVNNCYFDKSVNKCGAIGYNESYSVENALGVTTDKFTSGEVAYLLNGDQSTIIWKQN